MFGVCLGGNLLVGKRGTLIHFSFAYCDELRAVDAYGAALRGTRAAGKNHHRSKGY